jgi:hypothetical protein
MPDEHADDPVTSATPPHDPAVPGPFAHPEDSMPRAELDGRARADAALRRIAAGSDPAREAFELANELNDESVARLRATVARWFRRS